MIELYTEEKKIVAFHHKNRIHTNVCSTANGRDRSIIYILSAIQQRIMKKKTLKTRQIFK